MRIRETQIVSCAFSAAIEIAKEYFDRYDEPGLAPMGSSSAKRRRSCTVVPDHTDRARRHEALRLGWCDHHALAPPSFVGLLTVRPASGRTEIVIEGEIPGQESAAVLLHDLATYVESQWQQFVQATPTIEACNARAHAGMASV